MKGIASPQNSIKNFFNITTLPFLSLMSIISNPVEHVNVPQSWLYSYVYDLHPLYSIHSSQVLEKLKICC